MEESELDEPEESDVAKPRKSPPAHSFSRRVVMAFHNGHPVRLRWCMGHFTAIYRTILSLGASCHLDIVLVVTNLSARRNTTGLAKSHPADDARTKLALCCQSIV